MAIYSGIDEAGLGPILGPYCATVTTFKSPKPLKELLEDKQKSILYVDDSKKVYQGKNGLKRLELNVLAFYVLLNGSVPKNINSFIPSLNSIWNIKNNETLPLKNSVDEVLDYSAGIKNLFKERDVEFLNLKRRAVSPSNFNKSIDKWDNKATVCQQYISSLVLCALEIKKPQSIIIDKQGGRKFYKGFLDSVSNKHTFSIIKEEDKYSEYQSDSINVKFKAKADSSNFTVALASMFSKYMRELAMHSFNSYWSEIIPELKRTAGYYTDGTRFINDLTIHGKLPKNIDTIVRKK